MKIKTAGNGFANPAPERDENGITAQEFAEEMFAYSYCVECGKDLDEHTFVIGPTGGWFAFCDTTPKED